MHSWQKPTLSASAGAMFFDAQQRLLIVKPTYKKGWTLPGGVMEGDGETPWEACQREVHEEIGLTITSGRLAVVDTRPAKKDKPLGLRFLFHCGVLSADQIAAIRLQESELSEHRFAELDEALELLAAPISRRVAAGVRADHCVYLEDGTQPPGVR